MNFIFAKLYEEYKRKNYSPKYNITLYISIIYFFLSFAILLPIKTFIDKKLFNGQIEYEKSTVIIVISGLLALILLFVHQIYIKNERIFRLVQRYKGMKINKVILNFIIILTPVILVLLGGAMTVYLNGGKLFGNEINGLF